MLPVLKTHATQSATLAPGLAAFTPANMPLTWGAAIEVPLNRAMLVAVELDEDSTPGLLSGTLPPGASKIGPSKVFGSLSPNIAGLAIFALGRRSSPLPKFRTALTLMAALMQAGELIALLDWLFPVAATKGIPLESRFSTWVAIAVTPG